MAKEEFSPNHPRRSGERRLIEEDPYPQLTEWLKGVRPGDSRFLVLSDTMTLFNIGATLLNPEIEDNRRDQLNAKQAILEEKIRDEEDDPINGGDYVEAYEELAAIIEKDLIPGEGITVIQEKVSQEQHRAAVLKKVSLVLYGKRKEIIKKNHQARKKPPASP